MPQNPYEAPKEDEQTKLTDAAFLAILVAVPLVVMVVLAVAMVLFSLAF